MSIRARVERSFKAAVRLHEPKRFRGDSVAGPQRGEHDFSIRVQHRKLGHELLCCEAGFVDRQQRRAAQIAARARDRRDELDDALVSQQHAVGEQSLAQYLVGSTLLDRIPRVEAVDEDVGINEACHACRGLLVASRARREVWPGSSSILSPARRCSTRTHGV
jgi:hypothetical protein